MLYLQAAHIERFNQQHSSTVLWIIKASHASFVFGEPKLWGEFNGAEEFGHHFWAIRCERVEWNVGKRCKRHETPMSHYWSLAYECMYSVLLILLPHKLKFRTIFFNRMDCLWIFQYEYFFENAEVPIVSQIEQTAGAVPKSHTDLLLDNVAKIECKCMHVYQMHMLSILN